MSYRLYSTPAAVSWIRASSCALAPSGQRTATSGFSVWTSIMAASWALCEAPTSGAADSVGGVGGARCRIRRRRSTVRACRFDQGSTARARRGDLSRRTGRRGLTGTVEAAADLLVDAGGPVVLGEDDVLAHTLEAVDARARAQGHDQAAVVAADEAVQRAHLRVRRLGARVEAHPVGGERLGEDVDDRAVPGHHRDLLLGLQ